MLTQPMDESMRQSEVEAVLRVEYQLLCQCDDFKRQFDAHTKDSAVHTITMCFMFLLQSCNLCLHLKCQDSTSTLKTLFLGRSRVL